jgi:divalent metal cation (Fe/Co/Zn/Cd) transporter
MDRRAGWYSIGVNVILFALNLTMAIYSNSLALKAETAHNLLDLVASISVLIGVILSQRKTREFPLWDV